jgi:hypothetical protein
MRHVALFNASYRVPLTPSLLLLMAGVGCSTYHSGLPRNPDTPAIIYTIPQSQAFALTRQAIVSTASRCPWVPAVHIEEIERGGGVGESGIRGYDASYGGFMRHLYVIPVAGITGSGQQIDGFRFEMTYRWPAAFYGEGCEKILAGTLQRKLDATGTAATVTSLRLRPYEKGPAGHVIVRIPSAQQELAEKSSDSSGSIPIPTAPRMQPEE